MVGGNYADLKGQAFSFSACMLINRQSELHSGAQEANCPGPVFSGGIRFYVFGFKKHDGVILLYLKTLRETADKVIYVEKLEELVCWQILCIKFNFVVAVNITHKL